MRSITVTLPDDIVLAIEARVDAGEYASESDLVREGLEGFLNDDAAVESWLRDEIVARCRRRASDPSPLIPVEDVMDRMGHRSAAGHR